MRNSGGYYYVAVEAFFNSTSDYRTRLHAVVLIETAAASNSYVPNTTCSGTLREAGTVRLGDSMLMSRPNVMSYLVKNDELTLQFKVTLYEEVCNGVPEQRLASLPDVLLLGHYKELLSSGKLSDVKFLLGGEVLRAHKAILAVRSPVFAAMFEHDMQESKENAVKIVDIRVDVFEEMLRFIYTGSVEQLEQRSKDLLIAAEKYALEGLKTLCEEHLGMKLTVDSAAETLQLADMYNADKLKQQTISFISNNLKEMKSTDWKSLITTHPDVAAEMIAKMAIAN